MRDVSRETQRELFHVKRHIAMRAATAIDADVIGVIARTAYSKYVPRMGQAPAPMSADFAAHIARDTVVVVESDEQVRGYMIAWPEADAYFIDNIAVDPEAQGRGLGRRLIEYAVSEAQRLGLRALCLYTNVAMTENLAMYRRIGFVEMHRAVENGFNRVYMRWDFS